MKGEGNTRMGGSHASRKANWTRRKTRIQRANERAEFLDSLTPEERKMHIFANALKYTLAHCYPVPVMPVDAEVQNDSAN